MLQEISNAFPYIPRIVERLQRIHPDRVILFGSYAYGKPHKDSDIDLIVVLNKHGIGKTYREKVKNRMLVGRELLEIEREVPIDTLVYTLDEWKLLLKQNSAFSRLIRQKGVMLYEADHTGMDEQSKG